jgi:hypothetical protein
MTVITESKSYILEANIKPIAALPGHFHLTFESSLLHAKNPLEKRTTYAITIDQAGLESLGKEIYEAIVTR